MGSLPTPGVRPMPAGHRSCYAALDGRANKHRHPSRLGAVLSRRAQHPRIQKSQNLGILGSQESQGHRTSGCRDPSILECLDAKIASSQNARTSGFRDPSISECLDAEILPYLCTSLHCLLFLILQATERARTK
eukprot:362103-Chlamydomonas_euryale.AAC.1